MHIAIDSGIDFVGSPFHANGYIRSNIFHGWYRECLIGVIVSDAVMCMMNPDRTRYMESPGICTRRRVAWLLKSYFLLCTVSAS